MYAKCLTIVFFLTHIIRHDLKLQLRHQCSETSNGEAPPWWEMSQKYDPTTMTLNYST